MAEPRHEKKDPATSPSRTKTVPAAAEGSQAGRQTAEKLPPPIFLILALLFGLYILFSSSQPSKSFSLTVPSDITNPTYQEAASTTKSSLSQIQTNYSAMSTAEQTFIAIKPDGVQRGLVGPIISRFENRGFKLAAIKLVSPSKEHLESHYADLKDKPFFPSLITYMLSGPIVAMVWEGADAVKTGRSILGATNPLASAPGTIRGDYALHMGRNVCHGSDSVENAKKEISLWFKDTDLVSWKSAQFDWVYEKA